MGISLSLELMDPLDASLRSRHNQQDCRVLQSDWNSLFGDVVYALTRHQRINTALALCKENMLIFYYNDLYTTMNITIIVASIQT